LFAPSITAVVVAVYTTLTPVDGVAFDTASVVVVAPRPTATSYTSLADPCRFSPNSGVKVADRRCGELEAANAVSHVALYDCPSNVTGRLPQPVIVTPPFSKSTFPEGEPSLADTVATKVTCWLVTGSLDSPVKAVLDVAPATTVPVTVFVAPLVW
jgi:hypothetical protein